MTMTEIETRERKIAGKQYDTCDRVWLRLEAMRQLREESEQSKLRQKIPVIIVETDAISAAFERARETVAKLESERDERDAWTNAWRPSDEASR